MRAIKSLTVVGLTALLVLGTAVAPAHAAQVTVTAGGISYTAEDTNVAAGATAYDTSAAAGTVVNIPRTVNVSGTDYAVTSIGNYAFYYKSLISVTLPDTLTNIDYNAFYGNALTSVRFLGTAPTPFGTDVFDVNTPVSYFWSFGTPQTADGFTSPAWNGYPTRAIAIIRYDTDGAPAIDSAEAIVGTTLAAPTNPTKGGFTFDGWYPAETGGTAWDFTTEKVVGDTTLFAWYAAVPVTPAPVTPAPVDPAAPTKPVDSAPNATAALALAATGVTSPAVPAGIGALVLLTGIALLLTRRRRRTV